MSESNDGGMRDLDIPAYNRTAWNRQAREGNEWARPVDSETIRRARAGDWSVVLTPIKPVPADWFGVAGVAGRDLLCLASGGGQQAPVLAAAGARVTSFDNSDEMLARDEQVAGREDLALRTVQGDMADLSVFAEGSFDLIFHPVSNVFVPDPRPVWRECFRVLRPGGVLLAGFMNPSFFLFDHEAARSCGALDVRFRLPFADLRDLPVEKLRELTADEIALEYSHSLAEQIGGQCDAGLRIVGLYEDWWSDEATPLNRFSPTTIATRALRPD